MTFLLSYSREKEMITKKYDEYDLKYKTNLFQIDFMTDNSFSETVKDNLSDVRPNNLAVVFLKLPTINMKCFDGELENLHTFIDSFECAIDKNDTLYDIQKINYLRKHRQT